MLSSMTMQRSAGMLIMPWGEVVTAIGRDRREKRVC